MMLKEKKIIAEGSIVETFEQNVSMGDPAKYNPQGGVLTFRGGPLRQNGAYGTVVVEKHELAVIRGMRTGSLGKDLMGFGYGSQPLIVKWYKNIREMMALKDDAKDYTAFKEVILPASDGKIYFYNLETQVFSRDIIDVGFPVSTTGAINPYGYPLLYVGQNEDEVDDYRGIVGMRMYDLINNKMIAFETGLNQSSYLSSVGTISTSPLIEADSDTLIYIGDNGMLYTVALNTEFDLENAAISLDPEVSAYAYQTNIRKAKQGVRASVAAYGDYAYFGDMAGVIQCVDMNTFEPVWTYNIGDSVMANVALEVEDDGVYLYAGNVINTRKASTGIDLVKIDALTGELVWNNKNAIGKYSSKLGDDVYAGLMGSPLIGQGNIDDLVIFNVNHVQTEEKNVFCSVVYALDKVTGEEVWSQMIDVDSISSPIAMYESDGTSYIVMGDENGTLRLMDGFTGLTISTVNLGSAIQSSPAAYGNHIVVGTTGGMIYFVELK